MSRSSSGAPRLSKITEAWDTAADGQQWQLAQHRYSLAAKLAEQRIVAEIGCGTGFGLARVASWAKSALGIDLDEDNLAIARRRAPECSFVRGDATALPLRTDSVDVLVGLEMVYYIRQQPVFFGEAARVLKPMGSLLLTMPNPTRRFFQRSPYSTHYLDYDEVMQIFTAASFEARLYGSHELVALNPLKEQIRRLLVASRLMPRSIRGRSRIKSLANRDMRRLGDLELDLSVAPGVAITSRTDAERYAVWTVIGTLADGKTEDGSAARWAGGLR